MKTAPFVLRKGSVPKKYDHISFVPPKGVRNEAKRGLKLRREHGRGGLSTKQASSHGIGSGVQRAVTLASGGRVSPGTIKRMRSFFARHSAYKEHHKDRTSAAYISWLLWGGDAGERWANKVYAQMERADEEMKKAVAGGERAGHKYIRRIRTARNGRMGWRYIYKRPKIQGDGQVEQGDTEERTPSGYLSMDVLRDYELDHAVTFASPAPLEDTKDAFAVQLADRSYVLLDADTLLKELDKESGYEEFVSTLITQELGDLATEWEPDEVAESIFDTEVDHGGTFEAMADAPMGELEPMPADFLQSLFDGAADEQQAGDDDGPVSGTEEEEADGVPDLAVAAEQHETLTETLRENPELEPLADAIDAIAPVKDGKINLPKKKVGKAIALLTLITAVETYKIATVENDNAPDLNDLESASRRGLKQIDKDKIAEAKAKMRESLNKERQAARDKMTREKLVARLKERQEKQKARQEARDKKEREKKEAAEAKEKTRQEARDKKEREKKEAAEAKEKMHQEKLAAAEEAQARELEFRREERELKEQRKEEKARERAARKEERAREREAAKNKKIEEAAAAKRQKEKDAADKKKLDAFEARSQERKEKKEARKKAAEDTPSKRRKAGRAEAARQAKEERKSEKEKANEEKEKADAKKLEAFQERATQSAQKVPKRVPKRVRRGSR